jgi:CheY-like chemotaxis protein
MAYPFDTRNPRILIVDDNESAAETLFALLASELYDVTCVASGKEALARMNELTPAGDEWFRGLSHTEAIGQLEAYSGNFADGLQ